MSEVVNVVVALAAIYFVVRWVTSSSETPAEKEARLALGFRPKNVTSEMIDTVAVMFPSMPKDNIRYDLLRTGNVEVTTNKIIERGFLEAPPTGYYRVYPRTEHQAQASGSEGAASSGSSTSINIPGPSSSSSKLPSLISRYHLESRIVDSNASTPDAPEVAGGRAVWETTAEKREASLKERKAQMVLAARKRLLEQQKVPSG